MVATLVVTTAAVTVPRATRIDKEFARKGNSFELRVKSTMKKETWKTVIQVIISILTAALTALGTTSCMGHGPIAF